MVDSYPVPDANEGRSASYQKNLNGTSNMIWFLIVVVLILLWVISLYKVLYGSSPSSNVAFLSNGNTDQKRNIMLVIAHPDDESMFFSPTILYLTARGHNLHILCLSTGNADGKGNIRKDELYDACVTLKVQPQQIKILDLPELQDGFGKLWSSNFIGKIIEEETTSQGIDLLITFDNYGVSGHRNHRDVHNGICTFLCGKSKVEAWELLSTSILRKYTGPLDIWLSILYSRSHTSGEIYCVANEHPRKSFTAMAQHKSQWIWLDQKMRKEDIFDLYHGCKGRKEYSSVLYLYEGNSLGVPFV